MLFYREFWSFRKFFRDSHRTARFAMAELLYLRVYFGRDTTRRVVARLSKMEFPDRMFYFLVFGEYLGREYVLGFAKSMDAMSHTQADYRVMALSTLPEDDAHRAISSYLLYAAPAEKIRIMRGLDGIVDLRRLVLAMLDECFSSRLAIGRVYAEHLRLMNLFDLERGFKIRVLYSWMRYFLVQGLLEHFYELVDRMEDTLMGDDEFEFYRQFSEFTRGRLDLQSIWANFRDFDDTNDCARHTLAEIIDAYRKAEG